MSTQATIQSSIKSEVKQIAIGVGLLICAAQLSIPLHPVPITLQTVAVMLIGLFYSKNTALKTVLAYLAIGALGAPVFANFMGGISRLFGPTGGYLMGFAPAVYCMALAKERILKDTYLSIICNCIVGHIIIFIPGLLWLSVYVGFAQAITLGLLPFIIPGTLKAVVLGAAVRYIKK